MAKNITIKAGVGDEVYLLNNHKVIKGKVSIVVVTMIQENESIGRYKNIPATKEKIDIGYTIEIEDGTTLQRPEKLIFSSRQELLDSL